MATISVIQDLSTTPLTRQDLFDAWSTAALGSITADDLATGFQSILQASSFTDTLDIEGGQLLWVADEQLMYCYHDEIDGTGVSLWLAIGPDCFETACLLSAPAFPGALVEPSFDRFVNPVAYTDSNIGDGVNNRMIGNVHSGVPYPLNSTASGSAPSTQESGTWVRVGIDGFLVGWVPNASAVSEGLFNISVSRGVGAAPIDDDHPAEAMRGGMIDTTVAGGRHGTVHPYFGFCGQSLYSLFNSTTPSEWGAHFRYRFTGFQDQQDRTP